MVDEFQDTNGLQLNLIEQLRGPDTRLFLVGDEFQSIYGFRHADVEVYRREHRRFAGGESRTVCSLTGNFRAAPELVAATNAIGSALLDRFEAAPASVDPPVHGGDPPVEFLLTLDRRKEWEADETELPRPHDDPSSGSKVAEARRLAARLRELVDEGENPSEIVVLLRAFTRLRGRAGAGRRRTRPLRGRRPRLLVPAADRGSALPAGGGRQSARRRGPVRRPRLARLRGPPGHTLAVAAHRHRGPGERRDKLLHVWPWSATWPRGARRMSAIRPPPS